MTERSTWRPEHTLILAILVLTAALLLAVILVLSGLGGGRAEAMVPYGVALVVAGALAAWLINYFGKKAARKQRPEWLETQAWQKGLLDKLRQGQPGSGAKPGGPTESGSKDNIPK